MTGELAFRKWLVLVYTDQFELKWQINYIWFLGDRIDHGTTHTSNTTRLTETQFKTKNITLILPLPHCMGVTLPKLTRTWQPRTRPFEQISSYVLHFIILTMIRYLIFLLYLGIMERSREDLRTSLEAEGTAHTSDYRSSTQWFGHPDRIRTPSWTFFIRMESLEDNLSNAIVSTSKFGLIQ